MAKPPPNERLLTATDLASLAGISLSRLSQMKHEAYPPPLSGVDNTIPMVLAGEWLRGYYLRKARFDGATGKAPTLDRATQGARKDAALAEKAELENEVRRGQLIEAAEVVAGWQTVLSNVRTRLLRVPVTVAPLVVGSFDVHKVRELIEDFIRDALNELSAPADEDDEDK